MKSHCGLSGQPTLGSMETGCAPWLWTVPPGLRTAVCYCILPPPRVQFLQHRESCCDGSKAVTNSLLNTSLLVWFPVNTAPFWWGQNAKMCRYYTLGAHRKTVKWSDVNPETATTVSLIAPVLGRFNPNNLVYRGWLFCTVLSSCWWAWHILKDKGKKKIKKDLCNIQQQHVIDSAINSCHCWFAHCGPRHNEVCCTAFLYLQ